MDTFVHVWHQVLLDILVPTASATDTSAFTLAPVFVVLRESRPTFQLFGTIATTSPVKFHGDRGFAWDVSAAFVMKILIIKWIVLLDCIKSCGSLAFFGYRAEGWFELDNTRDSGFRFRRDTSLATT